jgi:hypothetical protein
MALSGAICFRATRLLPRAKPTKPHHGRSSQFDQTGHLSRRGLLVKENPKRPGSKTAARYAFYPKCRTVGDFITAVGNRRKAVSNLRWDLVRKFIAIG